MGFRYAIIGAGMQGTAAAYDLALHGDADEVRLLDTDIRSAQTAADRVNALAKRPVAKAGIVNASDRTSAAQVLEGMHACLSAVPYYLNFELAKAAIEAGVHFNDLGGNLDITRQQLSLDRAAKEKAVSLIPDCGVAPGLCNSLAVYGMSQVDDPQHVHIRCGGLPQNRDLPLGYKHLFSLEGLTQGYFGRSEILREGKVESVPTFEGLETFELPAPIGRVEAFTTSGCTSTCPETFQGKLKTYEYKTIRYPGHHTAMKLFKEVGFISTESIDVKGISVRPRDVFNALMTKVWDHPEEPDLMVLRVDVVGSRNGRPTRHRSLVVDYYDAETGFSAMERTTAFSAAVVTSLQARGKCPAGAVPLEKAVDGDLFVQDFGKRGVSMETSFTEL